MSFKYFENRDCEFYPCHNLSEINCLFCFCPLYSKEDCGGEPEYILKECGANRKTVKIRDCSSCVFPHKKENYGEVIRRLNKD
ncbi:MAG: cysteine-rich small domain-containing protein [Eubacteriales bacterium]|nr:cysteine-rich small domain-containing protein [Eubacteriales bacterium]MDO5587204.1 cysteine-rich small domain-containing protein [Clostridia bacterium]MDY4213980.1 cysteine-rich small domain-containing protein [Eubacteriales bacterium]MDY5231582.1 cysteine-rich small domain-containing protein [Eubacteriales bacterium]